MKQRCPPAMWARTGLPVGGEELWEQEVGGRGRIGQAEPGCGLRLLAGHSQGSPWPVLRSSVGFSSVICGERENSLLTAGASAGLHGCWEEGVVKARAGALTSAPRGLQTHQSFLDTLLQSSSGSHVPGKPHLSCSSLPTCVETEQTSMGRVREALRVQAGLRCCMSLP